jgi:hypothetical protein
MDDQSFQAIISGLQPDGVDQSALVSQLRGQHDMGTMLSMSPTLGATGNQMQKSALSTAKQAGDRRQQGLTRTRQAGQDKLAAEALTYDREKYTDIEELVDENGKVARYGLKDGRGPLVKIPDSDNLKERDKLADRAAARAAGGAPKRLNIEGTNLEYLRYPNGMIVYGTAEYPSMKAFAAARPDVMSAGNAAQADEKYATEFAGEVAKGVGEEVTALRTGLAKTNSSYGSSEANMRGIINAIDQGANPGQIYAMAPTITNATSLLESIVSAESLELLNTYQLKPVSDKDMAVLRQVAAPNLDAAGLREWATNKIAVLQRAQASGRIFEEWVATHDRVPRGAERDQLQKDMLAAANAVEADPGQLNLNPSASTPPPQPLGPGVDKKSGITTLKDGTRWDAQGNQVQ